ncbi:MAG TPA: DnaA N-terminal domain-containing protein [Ktedonobacterales bacterium]|nr:DnaA N-terminal domain-containing protein [Ktedonobacterales bacterium]
MPTTEPDSAKVNTQLEALIRTLLTDRPIAYHATVAKATGSATAGLLLSQFLYWTPRTDDPDGWFYKTQADITDETALTRWEQEGARTRLKSLRVLEEKRRGVPGKMYFRVNFARLQELLVSHNVEKPHSTMRKNHIVEATPPAPHNEEFPQSGKPAKHNVGNHHSISEITSEITYSDSEVRRASPLEVQIGPVEGEAVAPRPPHSASPPNDAGLDAAVAQACFVLTGGAAELVSHQTQAKTLWQHSNLSASAFALLLADVCATVQQQRRRVHKPMAYFFRCLRDRLDHPAHADEPASTDPAAAEDETETWVLLPAGTDTKRLWQRVLTRLEDQVTRPIFETYLRDTAGIGIADGRLVVETPSEFAAEGLASKYNLTVSQALTAEEGMPIAVDFVVKPDAATGPQNSPAEALRRPRKARSAADGVSG